MTASPIEVDLLVVGSGAGGLTAAITAAHEGAKVLVVEKSDHFGGTSAMSGGGIWIPNSSNARRDKTDDIPEDSAEDALTYMKAMIGDQVDEARMCAFVESAPVMLDFLQDHARLDYEAIPYPDYYPEQPGARRGYRTQGPKVFRGALLGDDLYRMRGQPRGSLVQGRFTVTISEARKFLTQQPGWRRQLIKIVLAYYLDIPGRIKGKRSRRLTQGHALVGSLYVSLKDKGGELWLQAPMTGLISENGVVTGATVERDGQPVTVHARSGVVLAAGGFEHNASLREQSLPSPTTPDWSVSQEGNTGDGIAAGTEQGARTDLMEHAWWIPVVRVPGWPRPMGIFAERALPGLVIVDSSGRRFANEALPYLEAGRSLYDACEVPAWVVFGGEFRKKYPFGPLAPGWATPDSRLPRKVREIMKKADSIESLAEKTGVDPAGLADTIERNNRFSKSGVDEDFQRGASYYDQYYGDASHQPNPCIGSISEGPYYALPLHPGDIGTKGGLLTNAHGQVVGENNAPIPGLYACGNTAASVMGDKYLGAGATLGPAMTFGYLAARHALGDVAQQDEQKPGEAA